MRFVFHCFSSASFSIQFKPRVGSGGPSCSSIGRVDSYVCPRPGPPRTVPGRGPRALFGSAKAMGAAVRLACR
jgi:hypothetical protein